MTRSPLKPILIAAICLVVALIASVLAAQQPSTAMIRAHDKDGMQSVGSGVLIGHGQAGWSIVATAAHVVANTKDGGTTATFPFAPGKPTLKCRVVAFDRGADVAILGIKTPEIAPSPLNTTVEVGTETIREGFPHAGNVRVAPGRVVKLTQSYAGSSAKLLTHTPTAISGESGGPVRDSDNCVVGLVATTGTQDASGPTAQTIQDTLPDEMVQYCIECPPQYAQVIDNDIPPAPAIPKTPRVVPSRPTTAPKPETTVDYEKLAKAIIEGMAGDERFKGNTGPAGPSGKPGPRGQAGPSGPAGTNGRDANPAAIISLQERVGRLESSTFNVEVVTPNGEVLTGEVHAHGGLLKLDFSTY